MYKNNFNKLTFLFILFLGIGAGFLACVRAPDYPIEPVLTFKNYSKNTMKQNFSQSKDFIDVVINFTDGDGDLGQSDAAGKEDVFVFDTRDKVLASFYKVPFVAPQGTGNGINGEMTLRLYTTCCKFPNGQLPCETSDIYRTDTLRYKVWILDRAGHKSNELNLPPIYLDCTK
jgi:hypothetical protein